MPAMPTTADDLLSVIRLAADQYQAKFGYPATICKVKSVPDHTPDSCEGVEIVVVGNVPAQHLVLTAVSPPTTKTPLPPPLVRPMTEPPRPQQFTL